MKLHEAESTAQKAEALAQAAERTSKEAAQKVKGVKKEARAAKLKLKQVKKESKKATKAARAARKAADHAHRVSAKAAAHAAKADAKAVKARKERAASPKPGPKVAAKTQTRGTTEAKVVKSASSKTKRAPAAGRISTPGKSAVRPARPAAAPAVDRPDADFDVEFNDSDLKEIESLS